MRISMLALAFDQLQSPLFTLPVEIRLEIYAYALESPGLVLDPRRALPGGCHIEHPSLGQALPATCQKISREIDIRILYTKNAFAFTRPDLAHRFYNGLPPAYKSLLPTLTVDFRACVYAADPDPDVGLALQWFEYLSCPWIHYRTSNNRPCSLQRCEHLFYDLPNVKKIVLDTRVANDINPVAIARVMEWLLRKPLPYVLGIRDESLECQHGLEVRWVGHRGKSDQSTDDEGESWYSGWLCHAPNANGCSRRSVALHSPGSPLGSGP